MYISNFLPQNSKPKLADRIAFDPYLPAEDLLNEFLRNMINPDIDLGQSYYVGVITKILDPEDTKTKIDDRDVFYSFSDNYERITKDVTDKSINIKRKILFVHIPGFVTSDNVSTKDLNYDTFNKIRVEYKTGENPDPKIGNLVKLQFQNKNSFYNPYIIGIEDIGFDLNGVFDETIKQEYEKYLNCKNNLVLKFPDSPEKVTYNSSTKPVGGYVQAIREIENCFSPAFIKGFLRTLSPSQYGFLDDAKIELRRLELYSDVLETFRDKIQFKQVPGITLVGYSEIQNNFLIKGTEVLFSIKNDTQNINFKNAFYAYLKKQFESALGYTLFYRENSDTNFELNINLNFLFNGSTPKVEDYITISNKLGDGSTYYTRILPPNEPAKTISVEKAPDACDSLIADPRGLYQFVYGINDNKTKPEFNVDHDKRDNNLVQKFYEDKLDPLNYLQINYFKQLIKFENKSFTELTKINSNFYKTSGITNDSYGVKKGENRLNVNFLESNYLPIISNFLINLRQRIAKNELLINNDIKNVFILPREVLRIRKGNTPSSEDPNSRHHYGRAVDIAVYLKLFPDNPNLKTIVQISPEIVALYAEKSKGDLILGHGLFLRQINSYYNHIEFIDNTFDFDKQGSTQLTTNDRFFTDNQTDLEKEISKSINKLERLKELVRDGINYKNPTTGNLDPRFEALL